MMGESMKATNRRQGAAEKAGSITILLADSGGRELGGLPIAWQGLQGSGEGRVGVAIHLPAGDYFLEIPTTPTIQQTLSIEAGDQETLDLGRLGNLVAHYHRDGRSGYGLPLDLTPADGGRAIEGQVGFPLELRAGEYRVMLPDFPTLGSRIIQIRPGRLHEVEFGGHEQEPSLRTLAAEYRGALKTVAKRLGLKALRRKKTIPEIPRLTLKNAKGKGLEGTLFEVQSPAQKHQLGERLQLQAGPFALGLISGPPGVLRGEYSGHGPLELPALGAIEIHLKDPWGTSLRGAQIVVQNMDEYWEVEGQLGMPIPLVPGRYRVELERIYGFDIPEIELQSSDFKVIDLTYCGRLQADETMVGQPVRIHSEADNKLVYSGVLGPELLLKPGRYQLSAKGYKPQSLRAIRKKKQRPKVALRIVGEGG